MPRSHWLTIWASFRTARSSFRSSMKQPLRLRSNAITNGGNVVEILFPAIKPGRIARVETLSIQNLSGETVNASFGIISQGVYQAVYTLPAVSNATAWAGYFPLYLLEGDTLAWHVKGTSLSGQVDFSTGGETITWDENITIDAEPLQLKAITWNEDTQYDHTISVRIVMQPLAPAQSISNVLAALQPQQVESQQG